MEAMQIYQKLFAQFGPQGWWPFFDIDKKECVYHCPAAQKKKRQFEICVGAILTQNTAWKNVEKAILNLSSGDNLITPETILSCKNLEKLIRSAGYYNQKAKKLRLFAEWWLQIHPRHPLKNEGGGRPRQSSFCKGGLRGILVARQTLLSLWGIGPETADSILLYAFGKPVFVIDAYTKRLCKECGMEFETYEEYRSFFESQLPKSAKLFNEYHALIVAWGKLHGKNPSTARKIIN
jgi:endonuclease-3 related protein